LLGVLLQTVEETRVLDIWFVRLGTGKPALDESAVDEQIIGLAVHIDKAPPVFVRRRDIRL